MTLRKRIRETTMNEVTLATERILAERGISGSDMGSIAKDAGVAVGTLYNYFSDKDELIQYILEKRRSELFQIVQTTLINTIGAEYQPRFRILVEAVYTFMTSHPNYLKIIFASDVIIPKKSNQKPNQKTNRSPNRSADKKEDQQKPQDPGTQTASTHLTCELAAILQPLFAQGVKEKRIAEDLECYCAPLFVGIIRGMLIQGMASEKRNVKAECDVISHVFHFGTFPKKGNNQ